MKHFLTTQVAAIVLLIVSASSQAQDLNPADFLLGVKTDRTATLSLANGRTYRGVRVIQSQQPFQQKQSWVKISYSSQTQGLSKMPSAGREETWVNVDHICSIQFQPVTEKARDDGDASKVDVKSAKPKLEKK